MPTDKKRTKSTSYKFNQFCHLTLLKHVYWWFHDVLKNRWFYQWSNSTESFENWGVFYCSGLNFRFVFATFKVRSCNCSGLGFPSIRACDLKLFVCFRAQAVCSACYIGETNRNFTTPIREHLYPNKHSNEKGPSAWGNVSKSLSRLPLWFPIKNQRSLKIKEAMHNLWDL